MLAAVAGAAVAGAANIAGAALVVSGRRSKRALDALVALSAGYMIAVALLDVMPEAVGRGGMAGAAGILAGYLLVHLTQHALARHFHFGEETHDVAPSTGVEAFAGLLLHTFVDGVTIASGFAVSPKLGMLLMAAITMHKLPEGLAISSLFLAAGASKRVALGAAAGLGAATLVGAVLAGMIRSLAAVGLPLAGGVMLYVAASNLVPEFQARRSGPVQTAFFAGAMLYVAARLLLGQIL